jgi:hypothetical protein
MNILCYCWRKRGESRSAIIEILTTAVCSGNDFNSQAHVNCMTILFDEVTECEFDINDEMK